MVSHLVLIKFPGTKQNQRHLTMLSITIITITFLLLLITIIMIAIMMIILRASWPGAEARLAINRECSPSLAPGSSTTKYQHHQNPNQHNLRHLHLDHGTGNTEQCDLLSWGAPWQWKWGGGLQPSQSLRPGSSSLMSAFVGQMGYFDATKSEGLKVTTQWNKTHFSWRAF